MQDGCLSCFLGVLGLEPTSRSFLVPPPLGPAVSHNCRKYHKYQGRSSDQGDLSCVFSGPGGEVGPTCSQVPLMRGNLALRFMSERCPLPTCLGVSLASHCRVTPLTGEIARFPPAISAGCYLCIAFSQRQGKVFPSPGGRSLLKG